MPGREKRNEVRVINNSAPHSARSVVRNAGVLGSLAALALLAGCRQDMQDQPKIIPQRGSVIFADGRSARPQVDDTVARGQLHQDTYFYTGMVNGKPEDLMPFPVTADVIARGQERFNVYCTPCHSRVGNGDGAIVQRGYARAGNLQDPAYIAKPLGHYFDVMSHGFGAMPDYSAQLTPADRWAVAAYIRALQLSQHAKPSDVPGGVQVQSLEELSGGQPEAAEAQVSPATVAAPRDASDAKDAKGPERNPEDTASSSASKAGLTLLSAKGCTACHTVNGGVAVGPSFKGAWGSQVQLTDGSTRVLNAELVEQIIRHPTTVKVNGYPPVMPEIKLTDEELKQIEATLESLKK
jgi:mono/diheme cytochrome c family protein